MCLSFRRLSSPNFANDFFNQHQALLVHFASGEKIKWALDEDLRMARESLGGSVAACNLPQARIIHSAWWPHVIDYGPGALRGKHVVCFADNPPAFYLTQPRFISAPAAWIFGSRALARPWRSFGCWACRPYPRLIVWTHPSLILSRRLVSPRATGYPCRSLVIGNFHRDSQAAISIARNGRKAPIFCSRSPDCSALDFLSSWSCSPARGATI